MPFYKLKKVGKVLCIVVILVLLFTAAAQFFCVNSGLAADKISGKTYFISPDGNDSDPGTLENPWRTLNGNSSRIHAGDLVYLRGGIYKGQTLNILNSGTKGKYITYKAYNKEKPVIKDSLGWGIKVKSVQYIIIDGLTVTETPCCWIEINRSSYITVKNCSFTNCTLWTNGFPIVKSSYVTVQDCFIKHVFNQTIQNMNLITVDESDHCIFERLDMDEGPHGCIGMGNSSYNIIRNCDLHNTWQKNIDIGATKPGIEGRNVIQDNKIHAARHAIAKGYEDKGGAGIQIAQSNTIMRRNLIYDNEFYGVIIDTWTGDQWAPDTVNDNHVFNNTFYYNGFGKDTANAQSGLVITNWYADNKPLENNIVKNNIFLENKFKAFFIMTKIGTGLFLNNSVFSSVPGEIAFETIADGHKSVTWFESNFPKNVKANSTSDPLVNDASNADFRLKPGSPCINAAASLTKAKGNGFGKAIKVEDAGYFFDGFGIADGDMIVVGNNKPIKIISVNYKDNLIIIATPIKWKNGDSVNLPYKGSAMDIGALES